MTTNPSSSASCRMTPGVFRMASTALRTFACPTRSTSSARSRTISLLNACSAEGRIRSTIRRRLRWPPQTGTGLDSVIVSHLLLGKILRCKCCFYKLFQEGMPLVSRRHVRPPVDHALVRPPQWRPGQRRRRCVANVDSGRYRSIISLFVESVPRFE